MVVAHGHVELELKMWKNSGGTWTCRDGVKNVKNYGGTWTCRDGGKIVGKLWRHMDM